MKQYNEGSLIFSSKRWVEIWKKNRGGRNIKYFNKRTLGIEL